MIEDGIENTEKVRALINSTLQLMKNLTSSTIEISAGNLRASLDVIEKIVTVTNITGSSIEKEVLVCHSFYHHYCFLVIWSSNGLHDF